MSKPHRKVVLAYSGGLDTSVAIKWLLAHRAEEVVAVAIDVGQQGEDLEAIRTKALQIGASSAHVIDARERFISDFVWPSLAANACYEFGYPLATAIARPLIAQLIAEIAEQEGADALAHGCTAKGNDQVRFELAWQALCPALAVIAPAREWGELTDRRRAIEYAQQHQIPVNLDKRSPYSIDLNSWGRSTECGQLEDISLAPPADAYGLTVSPEQAPEQALTVRIGFEGGVPVRLDGEQLAGLALVERLNVLAGAHGVGRYDQIENRLVGLKSREIYEAPAAAVLLSAHRELEYLVSPRPLSRFKEQVDAELSRCIYDGEWFSPLRQALSAFVAETQARVSGEISVRLYKGSATVVSRQSPYSLYDHGLATYDQGDQFDHAAAPGFIKLLGLANASYARRADSV